MIIKLPKKFISKGFSLKDYGLSEMGWEKKDAIEIIEYLFNQNYPAGILGGDVYLIENSEVDALDDNWFSRKKKDENYADYKKRSLLDAKKYIEKYPVGKNEKIIFVFVFSEIVELDI
jgi:hypothetical protein